MKTLQTIIIGGGLSGLTLAAVLRNRQPQHRLVVLEKSARTGGVITTRSGGGIIAEPGPHGFLDNCEETLQLLTMTGLDREVLRASSPLSTASRPSESGADVALAAPFCRGSMPPSPAPGPGISTVCGSTV